jgi:hypothetical protein
VGDNDTLLMQNPSLTLDEFMMLALLIYMNLKVQPDLEDQLQGHRWQG